MSVSIKEVAKKAGVTPGTVSKVLNDYPNVSEITRKRVLDVVKELGYVPNYSASVLSSKNKTRIGAYIYINDTEQQIDEITQRSMREIASLYNQAKARQSGDSELLTAAKRLIQQDRNFALAEDYIHRQRSGEKKLPFDADDGRENHFLNFTSDEVFQKLYKYCDSRRDAVLSRFGVQYVREHQPRGWTARNVDDAVKFLEKWPSEMRTVKPEAILSLFESLGFGVKSCTRTPRGREACFSLAVNKSVQNQADYRHPIAAFGTQMKDRIDIVCLSGKRIPKQLVDDVCRLGITDTFIVLLDANLSMNERRMMAQIFFTQKTVGQSAFLVIDRVLALYLALQTDTERLSAMLQCTLPYTIYQPFTNGSGSSPDEMFSGRVRELASIRDMGGASVVYGGRQLGKTALLERAMHLDNDPSKSKFAIMLTFKGCRGEKAFLDILVEGCNSEFAKNGFRLGPCASIRDFTTEIRKLLDSKKIDELRLLLDETDDFLDSISATKYDGLAPLIDLRRNSNRRFKFVLAGLHNVCRAKNATKDNGWFGQLGTPLCVKPLTAAEARNLLVRPLRYLGYKIAEGSHVDTILTNTNYYPGIIQFFGYTLVQALASQYTQYYSAEKNPPYELYDDQLASIMNSRDLNNSIKDRLRWTLEMDKRYYMLARCIAVLYHLSDQDYVAVSSGFDVRQIREIAELFEIRCLVSLSEKDTVSLLDEMEEMGILSRPNDDYNRNRYLLRRRSFIDTIGPTLEDVEHEIALANKEDEENG